MNGTNGHAATNGHSSSSPNVQIFVTRDCVHFRPLPKTPLAPIVSRLFTLLCGSSDASVSARRAFGHCVLDHALPTPSTSSYTPALDAQIRTLLLEHPPTIACVQGPLRVDFLLDNPPAQQPKTVVSPGLAVASGQELSNANGAGQLDLQDVIFFGFTLHNDMLRCEREDKDQYARFCYFFLCALVHEIAHWILTKTHGHRPDELRKSESLKASFNGRGIASNISISQAGQTVPDYLISLGQRPDDAGARATDMLVGATSKVVSFADGDTDIVRRGFSPRITTEEPVLSQAALLELLGLKSLPKMFDVTGEAPILIGGPIPKWSTHDTYLVTSQVLVNSYCAHGIPRIGQLFN